jgi:hypothetical protein
VPGLKALANFAGGRSTTQCKNFKSDLVTAAGHFGKHTKTPSIWFYGDNDQLFGPDVWRPMFDTYQANGGKGELVAYGNFTLDAHTFLGYPEALSIWAPKIDAFLSTQGLPTKVLQPELLPAAYPPPSGVARVEDVDAVPFLNDAGRNSYRQFLKEVMPRVFVIARDGSNINSHGGYDPLARALNSCKEHHKSCRVYAVDDQVVWVKPMAVPAATGFAAIDDVAAVPNLNDAGRTGYTRFLSLPFPRAFALAPDGGWSLSAGGIDPLRAAMASCAVKHEGCKLYAVDDKVVW